MSNGEYGLLLVSEMAEMIDGMEKTCLQSIPEQATTDAKSWTTIGVMAAFSSMRQAFLYVQANMAKGLGEKHESN